MMPDPVIAADFDPELFVTPTQAYNWVLSKVNVWKAWYQGAEVAAGDQVLILVGERGIGKTWLLRHLAEVDPQVAPLATYCNLEERFDQPTPEHYVEAVEEGIRQRHGSSETILLLDTVPPRLDEHLRLLEEAILRPYLTNRRSMVIMALVHPSQVCWRAPTLRAGERYLLAPFDAEQTREQIQRLETSGLTKEDLEATAIRQYSGGLPLLNYLLATRSRTDAFEALLEYWFSRVPDGERERVRCYLEAVCLLDMLEHAPIRKVLEVFCDHRPDAMGCPAHPLGVLNLLRKHWLGQSSPDSPGRLILVEGVRRAAREMLRAQDAELYTRLQKAAQVLSRRRE